MRFGVCFGIEYPERVSLAAQAGFDYIEGGFCTLSRGDNAVFETFKAALKKSGLQCEAANGFLPGDLPILGALHDERATVAYIEKGFARGAEIGLKTVVLGSGKARRLPEELPFSNGLRALAAFFADVVSPLAASYGITVVIEPLRKTECNVLNTLKESAMLSAMVNRDNICVLADLYHMVGVGDTPQDIRDLGALLCHAHISNPCPGGEWERTFPTDAAAFDYESFLDALSAVNCPRCSIEAQTKDFAADIFAAGAFLRRFKE